MDIDSKIREIMHNILNVEKSSITDESSSDNISSWDSLRHIQLVVALEEEFDLEFLDGEITNLTSFTSIKAHISQK